MQSADSVVVARAVALQRPREVAGTHLTLRTATRWQRLGSGPRLAGAASVAAGLSGGGPPPRG